MVGVSAQDLSAWMTGTLLPRWLERAYDPGRPGYAEWVRPDGGIMTAERRTTLVTARTLYVFSHAHLLGVPGALAAARHGLSFLLKQCRRSDGRFSHACTATGEVIDGKSDFYDLAFVIFALAWYARATGEAEPLEQAEAVMRFIETELASPSGGFLEDTLNTVPHRQNPHMHLLEACHAMAESSGDKRWLERADAIVRLMQQRFAADGTLGEFFDNDWAPFAGEKGLVREPGHHYEWTWLLYHHERLTGSKSARESARQLFAFGEKFGGGAQGKPVINEVDPQGRVLNGAALLWPQTEYLKALAARVEFEDDHEAAARLDQHLRLVFAHFVDPATGLWANQLDASGNKVIEPVPVRVLYHLLLALADVCRVKTAAKA
ncbi:mannose-6-phosphate isomerase type 3 [Bosea sp. BK604]|nr:mannose-6-phosphate isomerase type 3 [Bosea sp. BK604]